MKSLHLLGVSLVCGAALAAFACGSSDEPPGGVGPDGDGGNGEGGGVPPVRAEFGLDTRPANPTCKAPARPPSTAAVEFQQVFSNVNLAVPMMMAQRPGDASRWFVAQRGGTIVSFPTASPGNTPDAVVNLATVSGMTVNTAGEGGLLGFAFHPKFAQNGKLYVTWTTNGGATGMQSLVGVLTSTDGGTTFGSYETILGPFAQPATNHNGGGIAFGKDGFLYLSFGDGGGGEDQFANGQKTTSFFSKVLRIDVDNPGGGLAYGIPDGNPFKAGGGEPATYAYGFRNPFRISVDRDTGDLWAGDVGQNKWEEIDHLQGPGGNYGWPCKEGTHPYTYPPAPGNNPARCPNPSAAFVDPVVEHEHVPQNTRSITGGVVYRGSAIPSMVGNYVYGDYETQDLFILSFDGSTGEAKATKVDPAPAEPWGSFAEDTAGEVYAVSLSGNVYKMTPTAGAPPSTFPDRLSKTGCADPADVKKPASGLIPFGVNAALWSDGAEKSRFLAIPDGTTITVKPDGDFDFPNGTVLVKDFALGGKKIETRLFVRHDDGGWAGYSYEWLDDQSDAVLLPASKKKVIGTQTWHYPSRSECLRCHTEAAGRSLGLELGQQNGDHVYPSTNRISNQLKTLEHIGVFAAPLGKPVDQVIAYPNPLAAGPLEGRARAYLHANCSGCHRLDGGGRGNMELTFATAFKDTKTCNVDPESGDLAITGAKLLVPGSPATSLLSVRAHLPAANRMPPLGSSVVDTQGVKVLDDWITSLTACP